MKNILLNLLLLYFAGSASASFYTFSSNISITRKLSVIDCQLNSDLNRTAFYKAMESDDQTLVDAQISELNLASSNLKNAFFRSDDHEKGGDRG